jgi:hypothetical protein
LACKPVQHQLSCPTLREFLSCCQPLASRTLSVNCGDERIQPSEGVIGHIASVQLEGDLI